MLTWFLITSNSPSVSLPGLSRIWSGTPILPMSCRGAAKRISFTVSSSSPSASAISADVRPMRWLCSPVSSSRYSDAIGEPLEDLHARLGQLPRAIVHLLLERQALAAQLELHEACLEQIPDPLHQLSAVYRLAEKVLGAGRERSAAGVGRHVHRQHQDREPSSLDPGLEHLHHLVAVRRGHVEVQQHEVRRRARAQSDHLRRVRGGDDVGVALALEHALEHRRGLGLVVNDQDSCLLERGFVEHRVPGRSRCTHSVGLRICRLFRPRT